MIGRDPDLAGAGDGSAAPATPAPAAVPAAAAAPAAAATPAEAAIVDRVPHSSSAEALAILAEAEQEGRRLTGGELLLLFEEAALPDLGRAAHALRLRRSDPRLVTYVIDRNVTYTNLCYTDCLFCAFNRHDGADDAYVLGLDEILAKVRSVVAAGGNQILLQGGHHPRLKLPDYEAMLAAIKSAHPDIWIHGFSPSEIKHIAKLSRVSTRETLKRLQAAGLASIPGGGAEILSDRVRGLLAPRKTTAFEWTSIMEEAHALGLRSTATMMFAHVETFVERAEHLLRLRESQDRTGGYNAFICWTYQPHHTPLNDHPELVAQVRARGYQGALDYLRTLAIARIALDNFPNVQASWVTQGKAIGQMTLHFGANDLGSTMMEESVVSAAGTVHCLSQDDLNEMARGAGFVPAVRDNGYRVLRVLD